MEYHQKEFIKYIAEFAEDNRCHIWLGGSFLHGGAALFSDVDLSVFCTADELNRLIYGYGTPVYISHTINPMGILIVIYEDGVAVDLEIIDRIDIADGGYFHAEDIKKYSYSRNEALCRGFALKNNPPYRTSRLFHRSLIKYLSDKKDAGVSIANEIVTYIDTGSFIAEADYARKFPCLLKSFEERYPLPSEYLRILRELTDELNRMTAGR